MMNNDHTASIELAIEIILNLVDECVDNNQPTVSWENDGIGAYEFWGQKGFDKGNTYAIAEDCTEEVTFLSQNFSDRLLQHIGNQVMKEGYSSFTDVDVDGKHDTVTVRVPYSVNGYMVSEKTLHFYLEYSDELEVIN